MLVSVGSPAMMRREWGARLAPIRRSARAGALNQACGRARLQSRMEPIRKSSPPASALRGMAVHPATADLLLDQWSANRLSAIIWCPTTSPRLREGAFFGWPWFYIGGIEDPHHAGERPELRGKVTIPDVLIPGPPARLG